MSKRVLIAGAGIAGLAAALALRQRAMEVTVLESAPEFGEVGAGIQLGPNAMRVVAALGLEQELMRVACEPEAVVIADAHTGKPISRMLLGRAVRERYGQAYVSVHRADLHGVLLRAAQQAGVRLHSSQTLQNFEQSTQGLKGFTKDRAYEAEVLIGADGLWSQVRQQMLGKAAPRATGHAAFRATIAASHVPASLRSMHVRLWWGRDVHVVSYPLRGAELWNLVVIVRHSGDHMESWSIDAQHSDVVRGLRTAEPALAALLQAVPASGAAWRRWNLFDRTPLPASKMSSGAVALLGDAAHPMLPYLAQGAGMGLEDAWVLSQVLAGNDDVKASLLRYAELRAKRAARVVQTARRNARIFHLSGPLALARDAVLSLQGTGVIGLRWLYGFNPCAPIPSAASDSSHG